MNFQDLARRTEKAAELPERVVNSDATRIRAYVEDGFTATEDCSCALPTRRWDILRSPDCYVDRGPNDPGESDVNAGRNQKYFDFYCRPNLTEPVIRQGYGVVNARRAVELAKTETHALNVVGCKPPRVENGRLMFVFHDDGANSVSVAGDFNGWSHVATPLKRNESGLWFTEIAVPRTGRFEYKFIINGQRWIEDPSNGMKAPDNYGGLNSVLVIE